MAYANCENEDCDKDEWWLQKPPEEYASGGPKCPECGTTRVRIGEPDQSAEAAQPEPAEPEPSQRQQQPARQQDAPAAEGALQSRESALQAGAQVGSLVADMGTGSPEEKAETQGKLTTALSRRTSRAWRPWTTTFAARPVTDRSPTSRRPASSSGAPRVANCLSRPKSRSGTAAPRESRRGSRAGPRRCRYRA